jgi:hypothetical protein
MALAAGWGAPGISAASALRLDAAALLRGDLAGVLRVLEEGLATDQHSAFVRQLAERDERQS